VISFLRKQVGIDIEMHMHDDFGMATAKHARRHQGGRRLGQHDRERAR